MKNKGVCGLMEMSMDGISVVAVADTLDEIKAVFEQKLKAYDWNSCEARMWEKEGLSIDEYLSQQAEEGYFCDENSDGESYSLSIMLLGQ